jgi:hypothetical protein
MRAMGWQVITIDVIQKARSHPLILDLGSAALSVQEVQDRQILTDTWLR